MEANSSMNWTPQETVIQRVIITFGQSFCVQSQDEHFMIQQTLEQFNSLPDYANYLVSILQGIQVGNDPIPIPVRQMAGITLKNMVKKHYVNIAMPVIEYVQAAILIPFVDPNQEVRQAAAQVINSLAAQGSLLNWPSLLPTLIGHISSYNNNASTAPSTETEYRVDGSLRTLSLLCQDYPGELEPHLGDIVPHLLHTFRAPNAAFRSKSLYCMHLLLADFTDHPHFAQHVGFYFEGLFHLANDTSEDVRTNVCLSFLTVARLRPSVLLQGAPQSIQEFQRQHTAAVSGSSSVQTYLLEPKVSTLMIQYLNDSSSNVKLNACEFWNAIARCKLVSLQTWTPIFPNLVNALLNNMIYTEEDISRLMAEEGSDAGGAMVESQFHLRNNDEDENDEEDDEEDDDRALFDQDGGLVTVRSSSAAAFDKFAINLPADFFLSTVFPLLQQNLTNPDWRLQECSILALGAIAKGCESQIVNYLPQFFQLLTQITSSSEQNIWVLSMSCWTMARFANWLFDSNIGGMQWLPTVFEQLFNLLKHPSKTVNRSALTSIALLIEDGQGTSVLLPYVQPILEHVGSAFQQYQQYGYRQVKSFIMLFDVLGTLADCGLLTMPSNNEFDPTQEQYLNPERYEKIHKLTMQPLIHAWQSLPDSDPLLVPLLTCLASVATGMGHHFAPYATDVFQRSKKMALSILTTHSHYHAQLSEEYPDISVLIGALDAMAGIVEALQGGAQPLVSTTDSDSQDNEYFLMITRIITQIDRPDVIASAFVLLTCLTQHCFPFLVAFSADIMNIAIKNLTGAHTHFMACNHALLWIGEFALRANATELEPFMQMLLPKVMTIITRPELYPRIMENCAICLGRLSFALPHLIAPYFDDFFSKWCLALTNASDPKEKFQAVQGFLRLLSFSVNQGMGEATLFNPQNNIMFARATHPRHMPYLMLLIATYVPPPTTEVHLYFSHLIQGARLQATANDPQKWYDVLGSFKPALVQSLQQYYGEALNS